MNTTEVKETESNKKLKLEVSPEQAEQLENLFEVAKALASPSRLAMIGALAARLKESLSLEELAEFTKIAPAVMERDLRQLAEIGFIKIVEWQTPKSGQESVPARVAFNLDYLKLMPQLITTLHQVNSQVKPTVATPPKLDERARTLERFLKDGRLLDWPVQFKRQVIVAEEIAKVFEPEVRYTERQVDAILKNIYEYDHCTLRRSLVDFKFLQRAEGMYWKNS